MDKYIKKMVVAELGEISEEMKQKLTQLGYSTRRHADDSDSEGEED